MDSPPSDRDPSTENSTNGSVLSRLFLDAALYDKFLAECGSKCRTSRFFNCRSEASERVQGFADLVAGDLDSPEKAVAGRYAKLSVAAESLSEASPNPELESYDAASDSSDSSLQDEVKKASDPITPDVSDSGESLELAPDEIIDLLIQEFGPLAAEGEDEKLIIEADGALLQDVIILGVMHLTTHRLSFHASLLASRPDLSPNQQVIKAGPVLIHRQGWRKKIKVWLELSHDMLSTYASSHDEDRIKPIRTILYSSIKEIIQADPKKPKLLRLRFHSGHEVKPAGYVEFDTEESAHDWRRELQGALFLYRRRRRQFIVNDGTEDLDGVRISVPLSQIDRTDGGDALHSAYMLTVHLPPPPPELIDYGRFDTEGAPHKLQFAILHPDAKWRQLKYYVDTAKNRQAPDKSSSIVIDFGQLSVENDSSSKSIHVTDTQLEKEEKVRRALGLDDESELWMTRARVHRRIASAGHFVVSPNFVCFWSKLYTQADIRYRLPMSIIKSASLVGPNFLRRSGMSLALEGQSDLQFDFNTPKKRDQAVQLINAALETQFATALGTLSFSEPATPSTVSRSSSSSGSPKKPYTPRKPTRSATSILAPLSRTISKAITHPDPHGVRKTMPKVINLPRETLYIRPSMHFVCLTIGSRGDVQPYIALGLGLKKEGHRVTIVTHAEYKDWVEGFGIAHRTAGGDPGALMKLSVEHKMFSPEFFRESLTNFRKWLDELFVDAWEQCQGADVLLESPSAMAGVHIAEALNIPYFRCFTMPWTKTTSFPHAFLSPPVESPTFNSASYILFDNVMWAATSGQINKWRRHTMKIGSTDMGHLAQSKIIFLYNFSTAVVPKPLDWGDTTIVSGYWFLDNPDLSWTPPPSLLDWMDKARMDEKPIVYIGFGSITVPNPHSVTEVIVKAVLKSGVRAIISKGWSARMSKKTDEPEVEIPAECYQLDKVPHDWLFPQIDAALHHGGAGTTGASLRAGIPTLIKPWFGDQFFWASRVHKLGAGLKVTHLRVNEVADALIKATTNRVMKEKAVSVGEKIRNEDGVHTAIHALYTYMDRASRDRTSLE